MKTEAFRYFPYSENTFGIPLYDDERVVFAQYMTALYSFEEMYMGLNWKYFTLTNYRLVLTSTNNYMFEFDLDKDIGSIELAQGGLNHFFRTFFRIQLRSATQFTDYDGNPVFTCGFNVFFRSDAKKQLAAIMQKVEAINRS